METWKLLLYCLDCSMATGRFAVAWVNGTVEQKLPITRSGAGLPDNHWNREKEYTGSTAGRIQQHFAAFPALHTGTNEDLWQGCVLDRASVCVGPTSLRNSQESVLQKSRRVFSSVHRCTSFLETSSSTIFPVVTRRERGMISVL